MNTTMTNEERAERRAAPKGHEVAHSVAHAARIPSGDWPMYSSHEGQS
jgi:hypothetical protein